MILIANVRKRGEIGSGQIKAFRFDVETIAVANIDGKYFSIAVECTHASCFFRGETLDHRNQLPLSRRPVQSGYRRGRRRAAIGAGEVEPGRADRRRTAHGGYEQTISIFNSPIHGLIDGVAVRCENPATRRSQLTSAKRR
jgi:hypothetical protein